jgi:hypothetical protein
MRIIDANTGTDVQLGVPFENIDGRITLLKLDEGLFNAKGLFDVNGTKAWVPLQVRFTHPGFFLQKVGFIPS